MDKTNAERARHTTFDKPLDDQPLEERRQESFESFELGAEERVSAATVVDAYNITIRRLATVERRSYCRPTASWTHLVVGRRSPPQLLPM